MEMVAERLRPVVTAYGTAVAVTVCLWVVSGIVWLNGLTSVVERSGWWLHTQAAAGIHLVGVPVRTWKEWQKSAEKIASLEERVAQLAVNAAAVQDLEARNKALETALGTERLKGLDLVMGKLIITPESAFIAVGSKQGVTPGMVVLDSTGVYLGMIEASRSYSAQIERPFDVHASIPVRVVGSATTGVLKGDGKKTVLEGVLQADPLAKGEILITSGAGGRLPEGIVVGQVDKLVGQPADVTKGAEVTIVADYAGYGLVWIGSEGEK